MDHYWIINSLLYGLISLTITEAFNPYEDCELEQTRISRLGVNKYFPLEYFDGFSNILNVSCVDSIRLSNMEINPITFVKELAQFKNLEMLNIDVVWKNSLEGKIMLPKIYDVRIKRRNWKLSSSSQLDIDSMFFISTTPLNESFTSPKTFVLKGDSGGSVILSLDTLHLKNVKTSVLKYFAIQGLEIQDSLLDLDQLEENADKIRNFVGINVSLSNGNAAKLFKLLSNSTSLTVGRILANGRELPNPTIHLDQLNLKHLTTLELNHFNIQATKPIAFELLNSIKIKNSVINWTNLANLGTDTLETLTLEKNNMLGFETSIVRNLKVLSNIELAGNSNYENFDFGILANSNDTISSITLSDLEITCSEPCDSSYGKVTWLELKNCTSMSQTFKKRIPEMLPNLSSGSIDNTVSFELFVKLNETKLTSLYMDGLRLIKEPEFIQFLATLEVPLSLESVRIGRDSEIEAWEYYGQKDEDISTDANLVFYTYGSVLLIFCLFGIFGNITSIFILAGKRLRSSTSVILIVLAIFDTFVLICFISSLLVYGFKLVSLILKIYEFNFGPFDRGTEIRLLGKDPLETLKIHEDIQSYFMYPLGKTAYTGSVYTTILITLERFVAVCWPLHIKSFTSIMKSILMTLIVLLFSVMINLPRWFEAYGSVIKVRMMRDPPYSTKLIRKLERIYLESNILLHSDYRLFYHGWLWAIVMYGLPIITLTYLNIRILLKVKESFANRKTLTEGSQNANDETRSITIMLVCVSTIFVICNIANGILLWVFVTKLDYDPKDVEAILNIPIIFNSSANFVVYILLGRKFRQELRRRFFSCFCLNTHSSSSAINTTSSSFTESAKRKNPRT